METQSESIAALAAAMSKFQAKVTDPKVDSQGNITASQKFKYASLEAVLVAVRPLLAENGLAVAQTTAIGDRGMACVTTLMHSSGEWLRGEYLLSVERTDPKSVGAALSYARRYSLKAMLGIAEDDDEDSLKPAHGDVGQPKTESPDSKAKFSSAGSSRNITRQEWNRLVASGKPKGWTEDTIRATICAMFQVENPSDLPFKDFDDAMKMFSVEPKFRS